MYVADRSHDAGYNFSNGSTSPVGLDLLFEVPRSHSDTPH